MNRQAVAEAPPTDVSTVDRHQWATLKGSLFPGASDESIKLVLSYCVARGLDPMKKPCHIVPMRVDDGSGNKVWRDVVFPGIYELRTTAQKTKDYMGQDDAEFGEEIEYLGVDAPAFAKVTVHRWHEKSGTRVSYPATARFTECVGTTGYDEDKKVNSRWTQAPYQMIEKCAEAAALRKAFPDELGGEMSAEEMFGQQFLDTEPTPTLKLKPKTVEPESIEPKADGDVVACSAKQANMITVRLDDSGISERDFLEKFEIDEIKALPFTRVDDALAWIRELSAGP